MLRNNLWVEKKLVNGTIGEVVDIIYEKGKNSPYNFPSLILCKFPSYTGPGIGPENLVPLPVSKSWISRNKTNCTRVQFPLALCYACSIYKSQGLTLDKVQNTIYCYE